MLEKLLLDLLFLEKMSLLKFHNKDMTKLNKCLQFWKLIPIN